MVAYYSYPAGYTTPGKRPRPRSRVKRIVCMAVYAVPVSGRRRAGALFASAPHDSLGTILEKSTGEIRMLEVDRDLFSLGS